MGFSLQVPCRACLGMPSKPTDLVYMSMTSSLATMSHLEQPGCMYCQIMWGTSPESTASSEVQPC